MVHEVAACYGARDVAAHVAAADVDDAVQVHVLRRDPRVRLVVDREVEGACAALVAHDCVRAHTVADGHAHARAREGHERSLHARVAADSFGRNGDAVREHGVVLKEAAVASSRDGAELGARLAIFDRDVDVHVN